MLHSSLPKPSAAAPKGGLKPLPGKGKKQQQAQQAQQAQLQQEVAALTSAHQQQYMLGILRSEVLHHMCQGLVRLMLGLHLAGARLMEIAHPHGMLGRCSYGLAGPVHVCGCKIWRMTHSIPYTDKIHTN